MQFYDPLCDSGPWSTEFTCLWAVQAWTAHVISAHTNTKSCTEVETLSELCQAFRAQAGCSACYATKLPRPLADAGSGDLASACSLRRWFQTTVSLRLDHPDDDTINARWPTLNEYFPRGQRNALSLSRCEKQQATLVFAIRLLPLIFTKHLVCSYESCPSRWNRSRAASK